MSRHTLDDGKTPDPEITPDLFDDHLTALAPPLKLVGGYKRGEILWPEFETRYLEHLEQPTQKELLWHVINVALRKNITLLCIESTPKKCHRRLLAEACKRLYPSLKTHIA